MTEDDKQSGTVLQYRAARTPAGVDEKMDRYFKGLNVIAERYGFKAAQWCCAPPIEGDPANRSYDNSPYVDLMSNHPYKGATVLQYKCDPYWAEGLPGYPSGEPSGLFTAEIKGTRWFDLWAAAEDILSRCGDKSHIYVENFYKIDPITLMMETGS